MSQYTNLYKVEELHPLLQEYVYGGCPPDATMLAVPSQLPLQISGVEDVVLDKSEIVTARI